MAALREIKNRIDSVKSTRKITSAMKMVSSAKLHKAQQAIESMLPYQKTLTGIMARFLDTDNSFESPYIEPHVDIKRVALVVFSSNNSLSGAFNSNVIRLLMQVVEEYRNSTVNGIWIYPVGKKVEEAALKAGLSVQGSYQSMAKKPAYNDAEQLAREIMEKYVSGEIDKVEILYFHFKSSGSQELTREIFLPVDPEDLLNQMKAESGDDKTETNIQTDYIVEPSVQELVDQLIPRVLQLKMYTALLDSNASEHAARTMAMQIATDNATELVRDLTKQYNKSRQQSITNELLDIVGGSMR